MFFFFKRTPTSGVLKPDFAFLLEDGFSLLLEDGFKLILE